MIASAALALAADAATSSPRNSQLARFESMTREVAPFAVPVGPDSVSTTAGIFFPVDPFGTSLTVREPEGSGVAVSPRAPRSRLTAILVADDRRVAVIDDATVRVGDRLRDGARVSSILTDRVWIVDAAGQWSSLTLPPQGR